MNHLASFFAVSDQPTTDGLNTYFVSMHGHALGIKVWLSGVGGDELFGGYPSFHRIGHLNRLSQLLQLILPNAVTGAWVRNFPHRLKFSRALHMTAAGDPVKRAYQALRTLMPVSNAASVRPPESAGIERELLNALDSVYPATGYCRDDFQRASAMETSVYMASQLLRDIDNFSMAHSIETRAPFLDHKLYEFVFSLPKRFKVRNGAKKPILTEALPQRLPPAVLANPKRGFTFPIEDWLKVHMSATFQDFVLNERNRAFWDLGAVERMWGACMKGRLHWRVLWSYYAFARWMEAHREQV